MSQGSTDNAIGNTGAAVPAEAMQVGGTDGTNLRALLVDVNGHPLVSGAAASGAAVAGNPVLSGGTDGANARSMLVDASGRQIMIGAAADGAAVAGNPVLVAGQDGANAQSLLTDTSGRQIVIGSAANSSPVVANPVLVAGKSDDGNTRTIRTATNGDLIVEQPASNVNSQVLNGAGQTYTTSVGGSNATLGDQAIGLTLTLASFIGTLIFEASDTTGTFFPFLMYPVSNIFGGTVAINEAPTRGGTAVCTVTNPTGDFPNRRYQALIPAFAQNIRVRVASFTSGSVTCQFTITGAGIVNGSLQRHDRVGTHRTTSEVLLWHDAFEGGTVNAFWTQSTTTMTIAQAAGVLTLNNSGITTLNTDAIVTSQRRYPKYPHNPLWCRFRANISANPNSHTLVELGLGAPSGVTAVISDGAFFRWQANGNLVAVLSANGTETVSDAILTQGSISTANYYYYDIIVFADYARFIVTDTQSSPIADVTVRIGVATINPFAVSHIPSFARVYVDATGGGTVVKLLLAAHQVQLLDGQIAATLNDQMAFAMRHGSINPTSYAQTGQLASGAAPAAFTPSNTAGGNATLGGEAQVNSTATSENLLSIFAFTVPTPYTYMLNGLFIPRPIITTALTTTACILEWFLIANCATGNISTGGGQRIALGLMSAAASAAAATVLNGDPINWIPRTPVPCLPGTVLHIGWKMILGAATGVFRVAANPDGYFN